MPEFICYGLPYFLGRRQLEPSAVTAIKDSGFPESIGAPWADVEPRFQIGVHTVLSTNLTLAAAIEAHADRMPIILAGDCTSAVGAMKGLARHKPIIVWYDAHGDFNTPDTTPSGFLGGMPLAMLVGRGDLWLMDGIGLKPTPETDVILTDGRDLDTLEALAVRDSAIKHLPHLRGLSSHLPPDRQIYVHLDLDVVDSGELPGLLYPVGRGPSVADVAESLRHVAATGRVAGLLVTLWKDQLASDPAQSLEATLTLLRAFVNGLGK